MKLSKAEKNEMKILYDKLNEIKTVTESKCVFIMRRLRLLMEKD